MSSFFWLTALLLATGRLGTEMIYPALPFLESHFNQDSIPIEFIITTYLLGFSLAQLIGGIFSDYIGRTRVLLLGIFIYLLGSSLCFLNKGLVFFLFSRFLMGLGIGVGPSVGRALLSDLYSSNKLINAMASLSNVLVISSALGPILAGWFLSSSQWEYDVLFLTSLGIFALGFLTFFTKRASSTSSKILYSSRDLFKSIVYLLKDKSFIGATLMSGLSFGLMMVFGQEASLTIIETMGFSSEVFGWVMGIISLSYLLGGFLTTKLNKYFTPPQILRFSFIGIGCASFLGASLIYFSLNLFSYLFPIIIIFALCRIIAPICSALSVNGKSKAGLASSFFGLGYIGISSLLSFLFALLLSNNPVGFFLMYGAIGTIGVFISNWSNPSYKKTIT